MNERAEFLKDSVVEGVEEPTQSNSEKSQRQEEIDRRSVFVGNVDYQSTPEQLEHFFKSVGVIERVTILFEKYTGMPKGYAYIEFLEPYSVIRAIEELNGKVFRGRDLRISHKRTNVPGYKKKHVPNNRGSARRGRFMGRTKGGSRRPVTTEEKFLEALDQPSNLAKSESPLATEPA